MHVARFVINLPERRDRRAEMMAQLARVGWDVDFVSAKRPTSAGDFPSIGARGCFLSHLATLKIGLARNQHVLVMEDDLSFAPDFSMPWETATRKLSEVKWSIFHAGHSLPSLSDGLNQISPNVPVTGAHFVLFHREAVGRIIAGLEAILSRMPGDPLGGPMHVDGAYSTLRAQEPTLVTFAFSPSLGYQRSSRSDIANIRLIDRVKVLRPIMGALRSIKNATKA